LARALEPLLLAQPALVLGVTARLLVALATLGLETALMLVDATLLGLEPAALGLVTRVRPPLLVGAALGLEPLLLLLHAALVRLPGLTLVALAAPVHFLGAAPLVAQSAVAPGVAVVTSGEARRQCRRHHRHVVARAQHLGIRAGDVHLAAPRARVAHDRPRGPEDHPPVDARVHAGDVHARDVVRRHEPPVIFLVDDSPAAPRRQWRPAEITVGLAPLDPGRTPDGVRFPRPAAVPYEPAAVVAHRPAERLLGDPGEAVVGRLPVPALVRPVARVGRNPYPSPLGIVVPRTVRRERIVEDLDLGRRLLGRDLIDIDRGSRFGRLPALLRLRLVRRRLCHLRLGRCSGRITRRRREVAASPSEDQGGKAKAVGAHWLSDYRNIEIFAAAARPACA
jgi:hypothetical protein